MQNKRVLHASHSLQFRVHTTVLTTLLVACLGTVVIWAQTLAPLHPPGNDLIAQSLAKLKP